MDNRDSSPFMQCPLFQPLGDRGFLITLATKIDEEGFQKVRKTRQVLTHPPVEGIIEIIPGYVTVFIFYDPMLLSFQQLADIVEERLIDTQAVHLAPPRKVVIPVVYGGDFGPDLPFVAAHNHLSPEEVVAIHSAGRYPVYMLGFTPGFPYLGGLAEKIQVPRLETPRTHVPAGAVGIANNQTGIYPVASPGGWRLIGRTPLKLFNPGGSSPFFIHPGDWVTFRAITASEYERIRKTAL
jgi:inhibitor of KinA